MANENVFQILCFSPYLTLFLLFKFNIQTWNFFQYMIFMYFVYFKNIRPCKHNLYCTISKLEIYMNPLQSEIVFEEYGISTDYLFIGLKESLQLFEICDLFR